MDPATKTALWVFERCRGALPPAGPVRLSDAYLRLITQAEALPENQPDTDKTWVVEAQSRLRAHYLRVRRE